MLLQSPSDPRAAMSLALDGRTVAGSAATRLVYRTLLMHYADQRTALFTALDVQHAVLLPSACDDVAALFRIAGVRPSGSTLCTEGLPNTGLIVAGCRSCRSSDMRSKLEHFFAGGGVLVTSGRSILDVPLPSDTLHLLPPDAPRHVLQCAHDTLPFAAHLAAGHIGLRAVDPDDSRLRVLAYDRETGFPLAIALRIGTGWLLHSVPHWYQDACDVPDGDGHDHGLADLSHLRFPSDTTPGLLLAASGMLQILFAGLETAFDVARN